jgi:hypothetical protein
MLSINKNQRVIFLAFVINAINDIIIANLAMPPGYKKVKAFNIQSPTEYPVKAKLELEMDNDSSMIENGINCGAFQNINNDWVKIEKEFLSENAKIQGRITDLGNGISYPYNVQISFLVEK